MSKIEVIRLISAFSVVGMIIGIIITIFAKDYTLTGDIGKGLVVVSFLVTAVCQIIIWVMIRRNRRK